MEKAGCADFVVDVVARPPDSFFKTFFSSPMSAEPDQVMVVTSTSGGFLFSVTLPMTMGILGPYSIEILLDRSVDVRAVCHRALIGYRWECFPEDPQKLEDVKALNLPGVTRDHSWGGYTSTVSMAHVIESVPEEAGKTHWVIWSGFQGFLLGVGPRVAKYLEAAPRLDDLLKRWASTGTS